MAFPQQHFFSSLLKPCARHKALSLQGLAQHIKAGVKVIPASFSDLAQNRLKPLLPVIFKEALKQIFLTVLNQKGQQITQDFSLFTRKEALHTRGQAEDQAGPASPGWMILALNQTPLFHGQKLASNRRFGFAQMQDNFINRYPRVLFQQIYDLRLFLRQELHATKLAFIRGWIN